MTTDEAFTAPFGPRCRVVTVRFDPEHPDDESEVRTEPNCESPLGDGFFENTTVKVRAASAGPGSSDHASTVPRKHGARSHDHHAAAA